MIAPRNGAEVGNTLTNLLDRDMGLGVVANGVEQAGPKRHRDMLDLAQINEISLSLTLHVVRCVFLEPVLEHVLGPVDVCLKRDGLSASTTLSIFADLFIKVITDGLLVLFPVWPAKYRDTIVGEVEQAIFV